MAIYGLAAAWRAMQLFDAVAVSVMLVAVAASAIAADMISGVVHWIGDTWGEPDWPILGPALIGPFREHHRDPLAIVRHDVFETNGTSALGALVPLAGSLACGAGSQTAGFAACFLLWLSIWLAATNQIHKWAHASRVPRLVEGLQRRRLILDPGHHAIHHAEPFDRYYCITGGWVNPLLQRVRLFAGLERVVALLFGAVPRRDPERVG